MIKLRELLPTQKSAERFVNKPNLSFSDFIPIELKKIPEKVSLEIEYLRKKYPGRESFRDFRKIEYPDSTATYIATFTAHIEYVAGFPVETEITFCADEVQSNFAGYSAIYFEPQGSRIPYIGYSNTNRSIPQSTLQNISVRRRGLAERRYLVMNTYVLGKYGQTLHSGNTNRMSRPMWEKFVKLGLATHDTSVDKRRIGAYRFII